MAPHLLSVAQLADAGVRTISDPQHINLVDICTGKTMDHAPGFHNLYRLKVEIAHSSVAHIAWTHLPSKASLALWHHHLSHINEDTIIKMVQAEVITGVQVVRDRNDSCSACHKGKQMRDVIPKVTEDRSLEVLGWVFSNMCNPIDSSIEGYHYFITSDFSQYTHVGLCKSKDEA